MSRLQADVLLVLVTAVWGWTFPAVKDATSHFPTFPFLALRFTLGALALLPFAWRSLRRLPARGWLAGLAIGSFLFLGYAFQTFGLAHTTASKAGFITGLSVVIVPVASAFLNRRSPGRAVTAGVILATIGLALLSLGGAMLPSPGDVLVFLCAVSFAAHILAVGRWAPSYDATAIATLQIAAAAAWSYLASMVWQPIPPLASTPSGVWVAVAATGLLATAAAYLVQTAVQRFTTATHTALIFSLEPGFAALFGYLLAGEVLTPRSWVGAALILAGILVSELPGALTPSRGAEAPGEG